MGVDFRGDSVLIFERVALSARPDVLEEVEEWWEFELRGWLARAALDERRAVSIARANGEQENVVYFLVQWECSFRTGKSVMVVPCLKSWIEPA